MYELTTEARFEYGEKEEERRRGKGREGKREGKEKGKEEGGQGRRIKKAEKEEKRAPMNLRPGKE